MSEYISKTFEGMRRYVGAGEGRDVKYTASAKPSLGLYKSIEVVVDANGPVPNLGAGFDNVQAHIPADATVTYAYIVSDADSKTAAGVTINLVKKDGSDPKVLFEGVTLNPGETLEVSEGVAGLLRDTKDARYAHASAGLIAGLKAKLIIEYI